MTNSNWREEFTKDFTTKVFHGETIVETTSEALKYFLSFIENQIALAEERGREEIKKEFFEFVDKSLKLDGYEHALILDKISNL